jgi:SCY1-like protein 1
VLGPLLKIGKSLTSDEYNVQIIPSIVKWFGSQDINLKMNLLQNLEHFIEYLSNSVVNDQIFPNVATGFDNPSPVIRELTVRAMLQIIPKVLLSCKYNL